MKRPLPFVLLASSSVGCAAVLLCGVALSGSGCRGKDGPADAATSEAGRDGSAFDANLPETVVVVLEAGAEPGGPPPAAKSRYVTLISGLPAPCQDTTKHLGTVSFSQSGDNVIIVSSKTKARATCVPKDPFTLSCDWVGIDGKPTIAQSPVTYAPKKPIGGSFDKTHRFACAPRR